MTNRLSAHIGYLFTEAPLAARPALAAAAGFTAIEHPEPFNISATTMCKLLDDNGLVMAQITSGMGNKGEKGIASLRGRKGEFRYGFAQALDYAATIGCPFVHAMAGIGGDDTTYRANIETAIRMTEGSGIRVLAEAISHRAVPGYHMHHIDDLLALARAHPELRILIDTFHAAADDADTVTAIHAAGASLGHVHIADFPSRAEPGTGQIDFTTITSALRDTGYTGAIGFEYIPSGPDHLAWMPQFA